MTLPGSMERVLNDLGFTWPEVDETQLFSLGSTWMQFGSTLSQVRQEADSAAQQVSAANQGAAVEAFIAKWTGAEAPSNTLGNAATGVELGGGAILVCAGVALGLKINTIVNIGILIAEIASAIAEAPFTFGASLAEIPVFKEITSKIINAIVNEAVTAIMG